ncbi:MAG: GIY-YIG nuclease family protein [Candidatus Marinimicrobia bacterium]|nr:GIY-YIG nuclease family protein [Candidatus Neomarinimicrobiota bacterium]
MSSFYYVYILISEKYLNKHYTGLTTNLKKRLKKHNSGEVPYTSKFKPWKIETVISFRNKDKAATFEKYLKSHAGRAFASKHF